MLGFVFVLRPSLRVRFPASSWVDDVVLFDECNTSVTKHRSRAWNPSIRIQRKNFRLCRTVDTDVGFLHIQLLETHVRLSKIHEIGPEVDCESSRSPTKSKSWNKSNRQRWVVFPTLQDCRQSFVWWIYEIKRAKRLSQALVHFVIARVGLYERMSSLPIRAKFEHCKTICEQTWFKFFLFELMRLETL